MKIERRYEKEFGWNDDWNKKYEFHKNPILKPQENEDEKLIAWEKYRKFVDRWHNLESKMKIPKWYKFEPEASDGEFHRAAGHNSLKETDEIMFNYLKDKKWEDRVDTEETEETIRGEGIDTFVERSFFVVDCSQLLGFGGEAIVIRRDVADKVVSKYTDRQTDRNFEALKIMPWMKPNFDSGKRAR